MNGNTTELLSTAADSIPTPRGRDSINGTISELLSTAADSITTPRGRDSMNGPGDAVWILTSVFIIYTMISGFGLVESGKVLKLIFLYT